VRLELDQNVEVICDPLLYTLDADVRSIFVELLGLVVVVAAEYGSIHWVFVFDDEHVLVRFDGHELFGCVDQRVGGR